MVWVNLSEEDSSDLTEIFNAETSKLTREHFRKVFLEGIEEVQVEEQVLHKMASTNGEICFQPQVSIDISIRALSNFIALPSRGECHFQCLLSHGRELREGYILV